MGHNNNKKHSSTKPPSTTTATLEMKQECERALTALRRGNYNKSLRLIKDASLNFPNSPISHRIAGTIYGKVAGIIDDSTAKQRHIKNAIDSAKKATVLEPNSLEYSLFYANLLYQVSSEYQDVLAECERALAIEYPNDPAKDGLSSPEPDETEEARVSKVLADVRGLVQQVNMASLTSWMKNLSGKVETPQKFHFISVPTRAVEDPVEVKYLSGGSGRRSNEVKKASKTPEERRKEIEVRVAAARLLQQQNEHGREESNSSVGASSSGVGVGSAIGSKVVERRRHVGSRRNACVSESNAKVKSFWNSLSSETKRGLLNIRVSDLMAHFDGLPNKDGAQVCEVLSEALTFGEMNQSWKFWACCRCGERFADAHDHIQHVFQEHLDNLSHSLRLLLPQSVDGEWEEMLINYSWKPLDLFASARMLDNQLKPEVSEILGSETLKEQIDDSWNDRSCSEEIWKSPREKKSLEDSCNINFWENAGDDGNFNIECKTCNTKEDCKMYIHNNSWLLSDDTERANLLEKISSLVQVLLSQKCLTTSHIQKLMHYAIVELKGLFPSPQILSCGLELTPLCICLLGAPTLKKIVDFLQEISHSCGFGKYPEKVSLYDGSPCPQVLDSGDRITLNDGSSSLLLDERLLHFNDERDDVGSGDSIDGFGKGGQSGYDGLLFWICAGSACTEQLATWARIKEEKLQDSMKLLETLGKEFTQLQILCEKKHELLGYQEVLQGLEDLLLEERMDTELVTDVSYRSCDSILQKRMEELVEGDNEIMFLSNRLEREAISTVLKEAESLYINQYGYEDSYGGVASHICDLEAGEDDWRFRDYLEQLDTCIETILQRQKEHVDKEICKVDGQIIHKLVNMKQLELKLEHGSVLDYSFILLPLVKSFMLAHLEDLAEKDATEKSDAAREAFLAELALDSKKSCRRGNDNGKSTQEKAKDRKMNKGSRQSKDTKLGSFNDQLEASEKSSLAASSDADLVSSDILEPENNENMRELEDELLQKLELEAEERKLEETLEYQRRLENEAKQRLLAEQQRRTSLLDFDAALNEVALQCKNDDADSISSSPKKKDDPWSGAAHDESVGSANKCVKPGIPKFDGPNDGLLPFEQQVGKRGKRRNSLKAPEEKSTTGIVRKDQAMNMNGSFNQSVGDGESKTLRYIQAEEDEEERFQADLKKAVMESLDSFQSRQKMPLVSNSRNETNPLEDFEKFGTEADGATCENVHNKDLVGPGLQNEVGEYNCYLNVIIQSLWHLRQFREEFLRRSASEHVHVGDPCVVCGLYDVFTALGRASEDANSEPVNPSMFRIALSNLYPDNNFFLEGQMNDASEVLGVIFQCLHQSFTSGLRSSDSDTAKSNGSGSWDCSSTSCIVHRLFGMDIFERMNCYNCGLESRHLKYTSFFHNTNASALRTFKIMCMENEFVELLNLMEMNHQLTCDPDADGCGRLNHIHHILSKPPRVFTAVLGWQNACESLDDIKATLTALSTEMDISILYRGLDPLNPHRLAVVVCYYGQHYHCFAYSHEHEKWIMYDDKTVKVIGTWEDVLSMCERGHLQPQVLFYESVN